MLAKRTSSKHEKHELPPLPYPSNALEPFLSKESFRYHYGHHHKRYIEKTNELIKGTEFEDASFEETLMSASGDLLNNAAQAWNHTFFWSSMAPRRIRTDSNHFLEVFNESFESSDNFKAMLKKIGTEHFGSGWIWLTSDGKKLSLETTANADNPLRHGKRPIVVCDLWEHAYYIDFRDRRDKFLEGFIKHINWDFATENFDKEPPELWHSLKPDNLV